MSSINVIRPGFKVIIRQSIEAVITGVLISNDNHVTYECAWWDGNTRHRVWLERFEITDYYRPDQAAIGFQTPERAA